MLTARQIRCIARGEWEDYFYWKVTHRYFHSVWVAVLLLVLSLTLIFVTSNIVSRQPVNYYESVVDAGIVSVSYEHGTTIIRQNDKMLPILPEDSDVAETEATSTLNVIWLILGCLATLLALLCQKRYTDRKEDYISEVEQKYIDSNFKQIPDKQSVIDFVAGGK